MDTDSKRANLAAPLWCLVVLAMLASSAVLWMSWQSYADEVAKAEAEAEQRERQRDWVEYDRMHR